MPIIAGRHTATIEEAFAVFHIGMRINRLWQVHKWLPVMRAMPKMLAELNRRPELGLIHAEAFRSGRTLLSLQYWRSFDHLIAYAHGKDFSHLPAWEAFNKRSRGNEAVGIFHETYLIAGGQYECVYVDMPRQGLLQAGRHKPIAENITSAQQRLSRPDRGK